MGFAFGTETSIIPCLMMIDASDALIQPTPKIKGYTALEITLAGLMSTTESLKLMVNGTSPTIGKILPSTPLHVAFDFDNENQALPSNNLASTTVSGSWLQCRPLQCMGPHEIYLH